MAPPAGPSNEPKKPVWMGRGGGVGRVVTDFLAMTNFDGSVLRAFRIMIFIVATAEPGVAAVAFKWTSSRGPA